MNKTITLALGAALVALGSSALAADATTTDEAMAQARQQRMDSAMQDRRSGKPSGEGFGATVKRDATAAGHAIANGARTAGHAVVRAASATGHAISTGVHRTGEAIHRATSGHGGASQPAASGPSGQKPAATGARSPA